MSKETKNTELVHACENVDVVSTKDFDDMAALGVRIDKEYNNGESAMLGLCGAIAVVASRKLYTVLGFATMKDYLSVTHNINISVALISESINTFKTFGNLETGLISDEWSLYTFSQLKLMRKLKPEDLKNVTPAITTRELEGIIKSYKAIIIEDSETANEEEVEVVTELANEEAEVVTEETEAGNEEPIALTYKVEEITAMTSDELMELIKTFINRTNELQIIIKR